MERIGVRYFNVFGPRHAPDGADAAVIPKFIKSLIRLLPPVINGDGSVSRDFTYVENIVQINIKSIFTEDPLAVNQIFNAACGQRITLLELLGYIKKSLALHNPEILDVGLRYLPVRKGDIAHSLASIEKAEKLLHYRPAFSVAQGITEAVNWYYAEECENRGVRE